MSARHYHLQKEIKGLLDSLKNAVARSVTIGDSPDQVVIDSENGLKMNGDSTVWDDIQNSLVGRRLASTSGKVDYNYEEVTITFESGGDVDSINDSVSFALQLPHKTKVDSKLHLHVHWEQTDSTPREWTVRWRGQNQGGTKVTAWTYGVVSTANSVFPYTSGTLNQITDIAEIDLANLSLSSIVQFHFARTDNVSGSIEATFVDAHVEIDSIGSKEEYVK